MTISAIEGDGLRKLMNCWLEKGPKYGKINNGDFLPSCLTLQRQTVRRAKSNTDQLVEKPNTAINKHGIVGIITDMWMDIKNQHRLSLTCHFIHSNKLISH